MRKTAVDDIGETEGGSWGRIGIVGERDSGEDVVEDGRPEERPTGLSWTGFCGWCEWFGGLRLQGSERAWSFLGEPLPSPLH